jgi:hypothetical protein
LKEVTLKVKIFLMGTIFSLCSALVTENVVIVVIDGARYSETFGDTSHTYIPRMFELSQMGTLIDSFYNDSFTYTSRAIPAIWCGAWTEVRDTIDPYGNPTQYTVLPSLFEYYRKQQNVPQDSVYYVLKVVYSLWQFSYHQDYGPQYWPTYHSYGYSDIEVWEEAKVIMETKHPRLLYIYLSDVDHAGHTGNWSYYTSSIRIADSIVGLIWNEIQSDPFYQNKTALLVTNDHGRHDDQHGGFQSHGDGCEGCRHIMFLAVGPDFKSGYVSYDYRRIPDIAPTIGYILGYDAEYATGEVMGEIFSEPLVYEGEIKFEYPVNVYPNPSRDKVVFESPDGVKRVIIYNLRGEKVAELYGSLPIVWDGKGFTSGVYFYEIDGRERGKIILLK